MVQYQVLSEFNAFLGESIKYLIRKEGNEQFLRTLAEKLPEECGFELTEAISEKEAITLSDLGNKVSNATNQEYVLVDRVPPSKVTELSFINSKTRLIEFLTRGRFIDPRETSKANEYSARRQSKGSTGEEQKGDP